MMAAGWIGIDSSHLDSVCGEEAGGLVADALDGLDYWLHSAVHVHQVTIDLGASLWVYKVRGRSDWTSDPIDVNIYVSDDTGDWGDAVATGINSWQETDQWTEVECQIKKGRYVKIEIVATESGTPGVLSFGRIAPSIKILDVYVGPAPGLKPIARSGFMKIKGAERLRGLRR